MKTRLRSWKLWAIVLLLITMAVGILVSFLVLANRGDGPWTSDLTITPYVDVIRFEAGSPVATLQVQIYDLSGKKVWDSGVVSGWIVDWDRTNKWGERLAYGPYIYVVQGWSANGGLVLQKKGKLVLLPGDEVRLQATPTIPSSSDQQDTPPVSDTSLTLRPMAVDFDHSTESWAFGQLGIGTTSPVGKLQVSNGDIYISPSHGCYASSDTGYNAIFGGPDSLAGYIIAWGENSTVNPGQVVSVIGNAPGKGSGFIVRRRTSTGWDELFRVDRDTGNVGIGTTTPTATLEVHGSATNLFALYDPVAPTDPKFRVEKTGTVLADGAYYGVGYYTGSADVAERINISEWVEKGDVIEIDPDHPGFFRKSRSPYSIRVAGIISSSPGVVLGNSYDSSTDQWKDNRPVLAITGRVPVKATTENGPIQIGDLLVSSSTPGYAMRCGDLQKAVGAVVGKAMEPLRKRPESLWFR